MEFKQRPILVGITGGTASGKTTVCEKIFENLGGRKECTLLPMDSFYKELTDEEMKDVGKYNFDHPDAMDWALIRHTIGRLLKNEHVTIPNYNYATCKRDEPSIELKCTDIILFEGIFALIDEELRQMMDFKIFVHSDDDIRLLRRLKRDVIHRGRTIEGVLKAYNRFVKSAYDEYIKPTMKYSDIIVPKGGENQIAIAFITENLQNKLRDRAGVRKQNIVYERLPFEVVESSDKSEYLTIPQVNDPLIEKILLKMLNNQDLDFHPIYFNTLVISLLKLFKQCNPSYNPDEWEFLPLPSENWHSLDLSNSLEKLENPHTCKNLCLFAPELVSHSLSPQKFTELCNLIYTYRAMHSIEKVHLLSPFMSMAFINELVTLKPKGQFHVYSLTVNQALELHHCFISGHGILKPRERVLSGDVDDTLDAKSSEMKIKAFSHHHLGTFDYASMLSAFYINLLK
ncbi:hypothetical protein FGO68_gene17772 [Halteria grandinella]|uniref:uridine/cytidine kinase n=1 Tax=Halteria grandinella TaxID=5974 RepID=A0A8J8NFK3_HALGN|nr:hypothetical protein FGO68_gene17772 [Halteria grandinella]